MRLRPIFMNRRARVRCPVALGRWLLFALVFGKTLAQPAAAQPPPTEAFFAWTRLQFAPEEYARRRAALGRLLADSGGGIFVAPSRAGLSDGTTFRQLEDFLYFTGLELPDSVLAIEAPTGRTTVFAPRRDARFENPSRPNDFPGRPLADDPFHAVDHLDDLDMPLEHHEEGALVAGMGGVVSGRQAQVGGVLRHAGQVLRRDFGKERNGGQFSWKDHRQGPR